MGGVITNEMVSLSRLNEGNKTRLLGKLTKARQKNDIAVAFIGGSITQRFSAEPHECYARLTTDWFGISFPDINVIYVNAGIGATGSYIGVHRVDDDVLHFDPDIVFVEFSVNDTVDETERNIEAYDSLLHKIWHHESRPAIITIAMTMEDGRSFQDEHLKTVRHYDMPMISYRNAVLHAIKSGAMKWPDISDDDIHPNANGHRILAELVIAYLDDVKQEMATGFKEDNPLSQKVEGDHLADANVPFASGKYLKATLLRPAAMIPPSDTDSLSDGSGCHYCKGQDAVFGKLLSSGGFETSNADFGNMTGYWRLTQRMTFAVKCRNIGIFYAKLVAGGGDFTIFIDGVKIANMSADFSGGWGDYIEGEELFASPEIGEHIIEIIAGSDNAVKSKEVLISAVALS